MSEENQEEELTFYTAQCVLKKLNMAFLEMLLDCIKNAIRLLYSGEIVGLHAVLEEIADHQASIHTFCTKSFEAVKGFSQLDEESKAQAERDAIAKASELKMHLLPEPTAASSLPSTAPSASAIEPLSNIDITDASDEASDESEIDVRRYDEKRRRGERDMSSAGNGMKENVVSSSTNYNYQRDNSKERSQEEEEEEEEVHNTLGLGGDMSSDGESLMSSDAISQLDRRMPVISAQSKTKQSELDGSNEDSIALVEVQQPHSHFSGSGDERSELLPSERYCADLNDDQGELQQPRVEVRRKGASAHRHREVSQVILHHEKNVLSLRNEFDIMQEAFQRNGSAAGDPSVLYSLRVGILDAISQGRLDDIATLVHAYLNLVNAKSACSIELGNYLQKKANKVMRRVPQFELTDTYGDVVYKVAEAEEYEDADVIFHERMTIIMNAIYRKKFGTDIKDVEIDLMQLDKIDMKHFCDINRTDSASMRNLCTVSIKLCIVIKAMSYLMLSYFNSTLVPLIKDLHKKVLPNETLDPETMSVKAFTEKVLIPAITSRDKEKITLAVQVSCLMREQMAGNHQIIQDVFHVAQQHQIDGTGKRAGHDIFGGDDARKHKDLRREMIAIYFSLILSRQIEAEFEPEVVTGLDYSLLCVSWRKLRDCSKLITKEFHTSAFGYPNDKTTEKKHALALNKAAQESTDEMTLVITSDKQAESLHKLSAVMTKKARSDNAT